ncbi:MAG: DHH family phosphoesterase, partial [bacterium]|nr:DHH family phosphoesterase [bacterium]MDW8164305.1 DHHA1 domain-containing protein [Candidatus Omnitrophota bacterium]
YSHPSFNSENIELSATGLSFNLFQNLISHYNFYYLNDYISIAGLATLSENLNLKEDNRIFVKEMLKDIKYSKIKGLNYLVSRYLKKGSFEIEEIKVKINPKLNSPGRFGKPEISLNLLLEEEEKEIEKILKEIEQIDKERYKIVKKLIHNIEKKDGFEERFLVFENIPESLCGLIASRLTEKFSLPFFVLSKKGDILKGSARSPENYNLYESLKKIKGSFLSFGGHKNAIGVKFYKDKEEEIKSYWKDLKIEKNSEKDYYDAILEIENIKPELLNYLDLLKPYGKGNNPPIFLSRNVQIKEIKKGEENKYWVKKKDVIFECIFLTSKEIKKGTIDIFYTPEVKKIDGYYKIYLKIMNFK